MLGVLVSDPAQDLQETAVVDGAFGEPVCAHEETPVCEVAADPEGAEGAVLGRGETWLNPSVFLPRSKSSRPRKPPATSSSIRFKHPGGIGVFIGLRGHAGGEWSLFAEFPDETWVNVGSGCARAGINYLPAPTAAS